MKRLLLLAIIAILFTSCQKKFNKTEWQKEENKEILTKYNSRIKMIDDLMSNHLKKEMLKQEVISLLGKPESDTIGAYLPRNIKKPDTLKMKYILNLSKNEQDLKRKQLNAWWKDKYRPAPIMTYYIGYNIIDYEFLKIRLNNNDEIVDFWIQ